MSGAVSVLSEEQVLRPKGICGWVLFPVRVCFGDGKEKAGEMVGLGRRGFRLSFCLVKGKGK